MPHINPHILRISRIRDNYQPVDQLRLHASERDSSIPTEIWDKFIHGLHSNDITFYPNFDLAYQLISQYSGIDSQHIELFDGSTTAIRNIFHVFAPTGTKILTTNPNFPMYAVTAAMFGIQTVTVNYESYCFPLEQLVASITPGISVVILSNPASPVGHILDPESLAIIHQACVKVNALLVIDEAYIEFSTAASQCSIATQDDTIIIIKTLSKAAGSAGVRIGYSISSAANKQLLSRVRSLNEITSLGIAWLKILVQHKSLVIDYVNDVVRNRQHLVQQLNQANCLYVPSETNFLHVAVPSQLRNIITREYKFAWDDTVYTRLSVPAHADHYQQLLTSILNGVSINKRSLQ
jgi:histidinol-phosphate aminotransferase